MQQYYVGKANERRPEKEQDISIHIFPREERRGRKCDRENVKQFLNGNLRSASGYGASAILQDSRRSTVQPLLSPLPANLKLKIHETIILPALLHESGP